MTKRFCLECHSESKPAQSAIGAVGLVIGCVLAFGVFAALMSGGGNFVTIVFAITAIALIVFGARTVRQRCAECGSARLVPSTSPIARKHLATLTGSADKKSDGGGR